MASQKDYLDYIIDCLSEAKDIAFRAMMGEYVIYCRSRVVGGIYDDRFLVKNTPAARRLMPDAPFEIPYEGAKEMLLVEDVDDRDFLMTLFNETADELPPPKPENPRR